MKKVLVTLTILVLVSSLSFAQTYKKGVTNLNAGVSIGGLAGLYGTSDFPPLSLGLQFGIHEKLSIGGIVGYSQSTYDWGGFFSGTKYTWTYKYIIVGARGEYHFVDVDVKNMDLYAGATVGYNIVSVTEPTGTGLGYTAQGSYLLYGFHAGARYMFSPKFGVFGELGYGIGYITLGVNLQL